MKELIFTNSSLSFKIFPKLNYLQMQFENVDQNLLEIITDQVKKEARNWLQEKISQIVGNLSAKDLYLTYSLIPTKIDLVEDLNLSAMYSELGNYEFPQKANIHEIARIYLLYRVLTEDHDFFAPKVAKLIEVADTSELETFLKFLILLPNAEDYKSTAVDALRTNISTIFKAIAHHNPYPSLYFDEQQWNQMYLKTAFMQEDLSAITDIDKRANKDLTRIISDYAHERWAAGRDIDPDFWRPVARFLDDTLLEDMERLLKSKDSRENGAGALSCFYSENPKAKRLLDDYKSLVQQIENKELSWENLKVQ